jgi:predicted alpha/beta hydrolase
MLTVGAQYAYWCDYSAVQRARLFWKWHVVMPALTGALGYFPGRRLGWLEDLPAGVALEWSFRRQRMEASYPRRERVQLLERFGAVTAAILAVGLSDDPLGTPRAIERTLGYYRAADKTQLLLAPPDFGFEAIGHFGLFHERHRAGFWRQSLQWLETGENPWPFAEIARPVAVEPTDRSS